MSLSGFSESVMQPREELANNLATICETMHEHALEKNEQLRDLLGQAREQNRCLDACLNWSKAMREENEEEEKKNKKRTVGNGSHTARHVAASPNSDCTITQEELRATQMLVDEVQKEDHDDEKVAKAERLLSVFAEFTALYQRRAGNGIATVVQWGQEKYRWTERENGLLGIVASLTQPLVAITGLETTEEYERKFGEIVGAAKRGELNAFKLPEHAARSSDQTVDDPGNGSNPPDSKTKDPEWATSTTKQNLPSEEATAKQLHEWIHELHKNALANSGLFTPATAQIDGELACKIVSHFEKLTGDYAKPRLELLMDTIRGRAGQAEQGSDCEKGTLGALAIATQTLMVMTGTEADEAFWSKWVECVRPAAPALRREVKVVRERKEAKNEETKREVAKRQGARSTELESEEDEWSALEE